MPPEMILVFMLTTYIDEKPQPEPSYWIDINRCMYFAKKIRQQNANFEYKPYGHPKISATCTPKLVDKRTRRWR
jgi:hypothetical protein